MLSVVNFKIFVVWDNKGCIVLYLIVIVSLDCSGFVDWNKWLVFFFWFCLRVMIKCFMEFEDVVVLFRDEVLYIVRIFECWNGDFVLYILVGDIEFGFEILKYILDLFFFGKLLDEKNNEGKSVFFIVWDFDLEKVLMLFFLGFLYSFE